MEQLERIAAMEERLVRLTRWQADMERALNAFPQAQEDMETLSDYLGSPEWRRDFEDDEAGKLPPRLPRGVLSEDGIYNALEKQQELLEALWEE